MPKDNATPNSGLTIGPGMQVTLHFALKLEDGAVVDSTFDRAPATFTVGDGNLLVGFEQRLLGLTSGHKGIFVIEPEQAFGQVNPDNVQELSRDHFAADIELETGLVMTFSDAQKMEMPGVITAWDEQVVTVDFNHPLAGRDILFEVEIIDVKPVITH